MTSDEFLRKHLGEFDTRHETKRKDGAWVTFKCGSCGKERTILGAQYRERMKKAKRKKLFCSHKCRQKAYPFGGDTRSKKR